MKTEICINSYLIDSINIGGLVDFYMMRLTSPEAHFTLNV